MGILPATRKMLAAIREGTPIDQKLAERAKNRTIHNTYMTVPLIFLMISNHYPTIYGADRWVRDGILAGVIIVGFLFVRWMYAKAAKVQGF